MDTPPDSKPRSRDIARAEIAEASGQFKAAARQYEEIALSSFESIGDRRRRIERAAFAAELRAVAEEEEAKGRFKEAHKCYEVVKQMYRGVDLPFASAELGRLRLLWDVPIGGVLISLWELDVRRYVVRRAIARSAISGVLVPLRYRVAFWARRILWGAFLLVLVYTAYMGYLARGY